MIVAYLVRRVGSKVPRDEQEDVRRHPDPGVAPSWLGMPWLSWHCFRRTHTTLSHELGMTLMDRMTMIGHTPKPG